jgi:hypothetical protein
MTDKIITTFETKITWYRLRDKIPAEDEKILIKFKNEKLIATVDWGFVHEAHSHRIEWWAYLPRF